MVVTFNAVRVVLSRVTTGVPNWAMVSSRVLPAGSVMMISMVAPPKLLSLYFRLMPIVLAVSVVGFFVGVSLCLLQAVKKRQ